jgi:hypothetical protein
MKIYGKNVVTTRSESKALDNKGVDIFGDKLPFYVQCKVMQNNPNYHELITRKELPKDKPLVVFHKKVEKAGEKFMPKGEYVTMTKEVFYNLIKQFKQSKL